MDARGWKSLCKKVNKLNAKYKGASITVFGVVGQQIMVEGPDDMKNKFGMKPEVLSMYKDAVMDQAFVDAPNSSCGLELSSDMEEVLKTHVFDMNVDVMRSVIAAAAGPPNSLTSKSGRRHWYKEENCPDWWRSTGLAFHSVNQPSPDGKKLKEPSLMCLVESLQRHLGITPEAPTCRSKTSYQSLFPSMEQENDAYVGNENDAPLDNEDDAPVENDAPVDNEVDAPFDNEVDAPVENEVDAPVENENDASVENENDVPVEIKDDAPVDNDDDAPVDNDDDSNKLADNGGSSNDERAIPAHVSRRNDILAIFTENVSFEEKCLKVMKSVKSWQDLWHLSDVIKNNLPSIPSELTNSWEARKLIDVNPRFEEFIPLTIGERKVLQASPNGNCVFNACSICIYGSEEMSQALKLASVVKMVDDIVQFAKYIVEEYGDKTSQWIYSATSHEGEAIQTAEQVEAVLQKELLTTLAFPYREAYLFHLFLLTHLLSRPIQQHCSKGKQYEQYKQLLHPPLNRPKNASAIHLVWVPTNPRSKYASINHVVPAVCPTTIYGCHEEECAFNGLHICALQKGLNPEVDSPHWIQCCMCNQWVHTVCMNIEPTEFEKRQFLCGCDVIQSLVGPIKRQDWYEQLTVKDVTDMLDIENIVQNVPVSARTALYRGVGRRLQKWALRMRFGPFTEEFVDDLNRNLIEFVDGDEEKMLIPDIYTPEVMVNIIMKKETVNRLVAEYVLARIK